MTAAPVSRAVAVVAFVLAALLLEPGRVGAQAPSVPPRISFQGFLTDAGGTPIDQILPVHFKIYRDSLTSFHVWGETQSVAFGSGLFNVYLGSMTPLPDSIFSGQELYLGLAVNTDPEMKPRSPLVTSPYSFLSGLSMCVPAPWYTDQDEDGFGIAGVDTVFSCAMPVQYAPNVGDCDDGNPARWPGAAEICDGIDNDCDGTVDSGLDTDADLEDDLCDSDDDNDGVPDVIDQCPLIPGSEANNGCPLASACPTGMVEVADFCIDKWEAHIVGESPYDVPIGGVAATASGVPPQGYISGDVASIACTDAGKRLCTSSEWLRACQGPGTTTYPYGNVYDGDACNEGRPVHPVIEMFGAGATFSAAQMNDPGLNQLPNSLDATGANASCVTAEGLFDMHGNLNEWIADAGGTFRGGFYVDATINGPGCLYNTTAHASSYHDFSTGFRCCADPF